MAQIKLESFEFREEEGKVKFIFMRYYHFFVERAELEKAGLSAVGKDFLEFEGSEKGAFNKLNRLLEQGMANLQSILGKRTVYIHKGSGIPLIGTNEFGIVDRDTNIIEVKPHTLCNLNCIYCSVDAGKGSGKGTDFLVEEEYLAEEFRKVSSIKKKPVEASINPQGEPLMYSAIIELVRDLKASKGVKIVSINTNGVLLTESLVDRLAEAGLGRINLSLNTLNQEAANKLAGAVYPLEKVKSILKYCDGRIDVLIAPLIVPGYNDESIGELIEFCKTLKQMPVFGFQNFLEYKHGRNPVAQKSMEWFMEWLAELEKKHGVKLIQSAESFGIFHDEKIPKPFRKGQAVEAVVAAPGKYAGELLAVSNGRCITLIGKNAVGNRVKASIVRDKHNIFKAVAS